MADDNNGSRYIALTLHPNGGSDRTLATVQDRILPSNMWLQQGVSTQVRLQVGDSVSLDVEAFTVLNNTNLQAGQDRTFFAMRWVGPLG